MAKQRRTTKPSATSFGIRQVVPDRLGPIAGPLPDGGPRPIDTGPLDFGLRFEAVVDPALLLSEEAVKRIEKLMRQAVLAEIAQLDHRGDVYISRLELGGGGTSGIEIRYIPK